MLIHDEQRLMTLVGGALDGRVEAWEAGKTIALVPRAAIPGYRGARGTYTETEPGVAMWEESPFSIARRDLERQWNELEAARVKALIAEYAPPQRGPWWKFWA